MVTANPDCPPALKGSLEDLRSAWLDLVTLAFIEPILKPCLCISTAVLTSLARK